MDAGSPRGCRAPWNLNHAISHLLMFLPHSLHVSTTSHSPLQKHAAAPCCRNPPYLTLLLCCLSAKEIKPFPGSKSFSSMKLQQGTLPSPALSPWDSGLSPQLLVRHQAGNLWWKHSTPATWARGSDARRAGRQRC